MCDLCSWLGTLPPDAPGAIDYSRVSDDRKHKAGRSVRQQGDENRDDCRINGWRHLVSCKDPEVSASRFSTAPRPGWEEFQRRLTDPDVKIGCLWETARGDRTADTWLPFLTLLRKHGKLLWIHTHNRLYDVRNYRDWQTLAEDGIKNHVASEETSVRVLRDMADAAREGIPHGAAPYGYHRIYDPLTRAALGWEPDPDTAPIAVEIITRTAQGVPYSVQASDLNRRGIPSPRGVQWSNFTIRKISVNPVYIAKRSWRREPGRLLDGDWAPLIDPDIYWDAVAVATGRATGRRHDGRVRWLLSRIATCGECHAPLISRSGATPGARRVYTCGGNRHDIYTTKRGCTAIVADWLDTWVEERVKTRLARDDIYTQLVAPDHAASVAARARAEELGQQLDKARAATAALTMSVESFTAIEATLAPAITAAKNEARALTIPRALRELAGKPRDHIDAVWPGMPVAAQRDIIRTLLEKIELAKAIGPDRLNHKFNSDRIRMRWTGDTEDS